MKDIEFIRWGGLSPQKQTHRKDKIKNNEIGFHTPPRKKGIFAFPYPYYDLFLLGATSNPNNPSGKSAWLKDENGNKIVEEDGDIDYKYVGNKEVTIVSPKIKNALKRVGSSVKDLRTVRIDPFMDNGNCKDEYNCDNCPISKECDERKVVSYLTYLKKPKKFKYNGDIWCHFKEVAKQEDIIDSFDSWIKVDYQTYLKLFKLQKEHDIKELKQSLNNNDIKIVDPYKGGHITICKDHLEVFIEKLK